MEKNISMTSSQLLESVIDDQISEDIPDGFDHDGDPIYLDDDEDYVDDESDDYEDEWDEEYNDEYDPNYGLDPGFSSWADYYRYMYG